MAERLGSSSRPGRILLKLSWTRNFTNTLPLTGTGDEMPGKKCARPIRLNRLPGPCVYIFLYLKQSPIVGFENTIIIYENEHP